MIATPSARKDAVSGPITATPPAPCASPIRLTMRATRSLAIGRRRSSFFAPRAKKDERRDLGLSR
jgi:hypothetical protein